MTFALSDGALCAAVAACALAAAASGVPGASPAAPRSPTRVLGAVNSSFRRAASVILLSVSAIAAGPALLPTTGGSFETSPALFIAWRAGGLLALALFGAKRAWVARSVPLLRTAFDATWVALCALVGAVWAASHAGVRPDALSAGITALTLAPLAWLALTLGGSAVLIEPQALWAPRSVERLLALRWLVGQGTGALGVITRLSTLGVALGVWLVLVAMGVLAGFEDDLMDKLVGVHGHLTLLDAAAKPLPLTPAIDRLGEMAQHQGAAAWAPFIEAPVAIVSDINYAVGTLFGIDEDRYQVLPALARTAANSGPRAAAPNQQARTAVVLGRELMRNLAVEVGDSVRLVAPQSEILTPLGPVPRSEKVYVAGALDSSLYEADSRLVVASLNDSRRLLAMPERSVTGVVYSLHNPEQADALGASLARVGEQDGMPPLHAQSFRARNQTLFAALALERVVAFVVLGFILLVASFAVVNTLSMAIWHRRDQIAMLRAMGATQGSILGAFLWQGALVGGAGVLTGTVVGVATLIGLSKIGIGLPYDVYYIDSLPIRLHALDVLGVVSLALAGLTAFALIPSQKAASMPILQGLRDG